MKPRHLVAIALLLGVFAAADTKPGLRPRSAASDYPAVQQEKTFTLAAERLTPRQVHGSFASDLNRGYVVIEVGIFPQEALNVSADRFLLRVNGKSMIRPATPAAIARALQTPPSSGRDVTLHPTGSIGYSTGSRDPYGNRYPGGVTTSVGVATTVDPKQVPGTPTDRATMIRELTDKSLPEGETAKPIAGYLYFPAPETKNATYELEFSIDGRIVKLALPNSTR